MKKNHLTLLKLSAQKNKQAFKELYEQTSPSIYSLALHFLHKQQLAETVLQEIYIEVWQSCASYNPKKNSVSTWILGIARNKIMNRASN